MKAVWHCHVSSAHGHLLMHDVHVMYCGHYNNIKGKVFLGMARCPVAFRKPLGHTFGKVTLVSKIHFDMV